jgi:hypothetical protein
MMSAILFFVLVGTKHDDRKESSQPKTVIFSPLMIRMHLDCRRVALGRPLSAYHTPSFASRLRAQTKHSIFFLEKE